MFKLSRVDAVLQIGLFAAFGGGVVSSLLLQDPVRAPIALFHSNYLGLVWTICWWLMNYCPYDLVAKVHGSGPVSSLSKVQPHIHLACGLCLSLWQVRSLRKASTLMLCKAAVTTQVQ